MASGGEDGEGERGDPSGLFDQTVGRPAAIGALPGEDQGECPLEGGGCAGRIVEGEPGVGGGLQPGLFAGEVAPAAVVILGAEEEFPGGGGRRAHTDLIVRNGAEL